MTTETYHISFEVVPDDTPSDADNAVKATISGSDGMFTGIEAIADDQDLARAHALRKLSEAMIENYHSKKLADEGGHNTRGD